VNHRWCSTIHQEAFPLSQPCPALRWRGWLLDWQRRHLHASSLRLLPGLASPDSWLGPFELAKNVVQTSVLMANRSHATTGAADKYASLRGVPRLGTMEAIQQIIARHGYRGLYTGVGLHAVRDTIGTGLYFGIYETAKQLISTFMGDNQSPFGAPMAAGALSGVIPWICTYPLDTRKTRAQSILLGKSKEIGEASMAVARSSIYKGMTVSIFRTAFQNMILLSTFEYLKIKINNLEI